jgi:hypothetical protein
VDKKKDGERKDGYLDTDSYFGHLDSSTSLHFTQIRYFHLNETQLPGGQRGKTRFK